MDSVKAPVVVRLNNDKHLEVWRQGLAEAHRGCQNSSCNRILADATGIARYVNYDQLPQLFTIDGFELRLPYDLLGDRIDPASLEYALGPHPS